MPANFVEEAPVRTFAAWIEVLLGAVFVATAAIKAYDVEGFAEQILAYDVVEGAGLLRLAALATILFEAALGVLMLIRARFLPFSPSALAFWVLLLFSAFILYGWMFGDLEDCGCLGTLVETPPGLSLLKNSVLLLMAAVAWRYERLETPEDRVRVMLGAVPRGAAIALSVAAMTGFALAGNESATELPENVTQEEVKERPFAAFVFDYEGAAYDLGEGAYLVALMSTGCDHCREEAPAFEDLAADLDVPAVGLMLVSDATMEEFRLFSGAAFPMTPIESTMTFIELSGTEPPTYHVVRGGVSLKRWEDKLPTASEVLEVMTHATVRD
jgi:thiol-disulfide isomerase/thioredoxin